MIKQKLINHINLLRHADVEYQFDINKFMDASISIMADYNCTFRYLRSDSKRNGHVSIKRNRLTGEINTHIAINRKDNAGGIVYTIIHELTHLLNDHATNRALTKPQAEVVADTVAWYYVNCFNLSEQYLTSDVSRKWDVTNYSNAYINKMAISKQRYDVIIQQINYTKILLQKEYLKYMSLDINNNNGISIKKQIKEI